MKVLQDIIDASLPYDEGDDLGFYCPHCHTDLMNKYENNELEAFGDNGVKVTKDPDFCECSSAVTVYWKCPNCGKPISDYISWDN